MVINHNYDNDDGNISLDMKPQETIHNATVDTQNTSPL